MMPEIHINFIWVLVAAAINMAVGAIWYSPALFVKPWMKISGVTDKQMKARMGKALTIDLIGSFITAFGLVHAMKYARASDVPHGMFVAFWNWLGFSATILIGSWTFENKPFKLFLINAGYRLVALLAMGAVLAPLA